MFSRLIVVVFFLSLSSTIFAQINELPDSSAVTGMGKIFEITNSEFINVTVESSNIVFGYVQSIDQAITINVAQSAPEILSTMVTIRNLAPQTSYNLIRNGSMEVVVSNEEGVYTFEIDIALPQQMILTNQL